MHCWFARGDFSGLDVYRIERRLFVAPSGLSRCHDYYRALYVAHSGRASRDARHDIGAGRIERERFRRDAVGFEHLPDILDGLGFIARAGVDLNQIAIPIEYLELVPREVAESSRILPVLARDDRLFLAMANPRDKRVINELEFVTGRRVYPYVAITSTLERTSREYTPMKRIDANPDQLLPKSCRRSEIEA